MASCSDRFYLLFPLYEELLNPTDDVKLAAFLCFT